MKGLHCLTAGLALTVLAFWAVYGGEGPDARRATAMRVHTVAFDNLYGDADQLTVQVQVDDLAAQAVTATCDAKTCTFRLGMNDGMHELLISVDHNGLRSVPTKVTLDTSVKPGRPAR